MQGSGAVTSNIDETSSVVSPRRRIFRILETAQEDDLASRVIDVGLIVLIAASVVAVLLESVSSIEEKYSQALSIFEAISVGDSRSK